MRTRYPLSLPQVYPDVAAWWAGAGTCNDKGWRKYPQKKEILKYVFT